MNLCGPCAACCVLPPIASIGKAAGVPCEKLLPGPRYGCASHQHKPAACRSFRCGWLAEGWDEELRPDLCGVMLTHVPSRAGGTLTAWELRPGVIKAAWDLWLDKAKAEPIAIIFRNAPPMLIGRNGNTYPITQP